ncbi:MAG: hypothetical protein HY594_01775, partial [Candidatus Omnitrophica bacterium]|nr:hypothetical protein [Candidatus Omnitrophota bacterium]
GYYEVWIAQPPHRPLGFSGILVDGIKEERQGRNQPETEAGLMLLAATQHYQSLAAQRWTRLTSRNFSPGKHRLQPLEPVFSSPPLLAAVPSERLDAWVEVVRRQINQTPSPITLVSTGRFQISASSQAPDPHLTMEIFERLPPEPIDGHGSGWQWLLQGAGCLVINTSDEPIRTSLQFEVLSPTADRTMYVSLDGQLLRHFRVKGGTPMPVIFENLELTPAEHRIDLYILEGTTPLRGKGAVPIRPVTVAIRDLSIGPIPTQALFSVPRPGQYRLTCTPFPADQAPGEMTVTTERGPLVLTRQQAPQTGASWWTADNPITLSEGEHRLTLEGKRVANYYAVLEEILPAQPAPSPKLEWHSNDPTAYEVRVRSEGEGVWWLVIRDGYDPGWHAMLRRPGQHDIALTEHFQADGYANAWAIDIPGEYTVQVSYQPQKIFQDGKRLVLAIAALSGLFLLAWAILRKAKRQKVMVAHPLAQAKRQGAKRI